MSEIKVDQLSPRTASGTVTLGSSGDSLTIPSGVTLTNNGTASGFGLFASHALIVDQKPASTDGGTATSGSWQTRDLNTEVFDPDGIVSISSNQFTLGAGNYFISWSAPAFRVAGHQTRLYDVTGASAVQVGSSANAQNGSYSPQTRSFGQARVSIAGNNTYELQHRFQYTVSTYGLGYGAVNSWDVNIFSIVTIFKEA